MSDTWAGDPWDDTDTDHDSGPSGLGAFEGYVGDGVDQGADAQDDGPPAMFFTATNPSGTVSVTALGDGRTVRVDLTPSVTSMTEHQLAEEISLIARLARQNARAGQHELILAVMQRLGHDRVATRGYLEYDLDLPSAHTVLAERAQIFATRYADDED